MKQLTDLNQIIGKTIENVLHKETDIFISFTTKEFIRLYDDYYCECINVLNYEMDLSLDNYEDFLKLGVINQEEVDEFLNREDIKEQLEKRARMKEESLINERNKELEEIDRLMKKHGYIYGGSK